MNEIARRWGGFHKNQNRGPLTGSSIHSYAKHHEFNPTDYRGKMVLEIGVGLGIATKQMVNAGWEVSVLDVCGEAFRNVPRNVPKYLVAADLPTDTYDLVISHLVTQHMSNDHIAEQFPHVFRSLKVNGEFFTQWAGSDFDEENNVIDTVLDGRVSIFSGRMVRTPRNAERLIERHGGVVTSLSALKRFPEHNSYWYMTRSVNRRIED